MTKKRKIDLKSHMDEAILTEYLMFLFTGKEYFSIFTLDRKNRERFIGTVFYFVCHEILKWDGETSLIYMNDKIIDAFKLKTIYEKATYVCASKYFNLKECLSFAFPNEIKYDIEKDAIEEWERVNGYGKYEGNSGDCRFHKFYFDGQDGIIRTMTLLKYAISISLYNYSLSELYMFFADTPKAMKWLNQMHLKTCLNAAYKTPLDYFYYTFKNDNPENLALYINTALIQQNNKCITKRKAKTNK